MWKKMGLVQCEVLVQPVVAVNKCTATITPFTTSLLYTTLHTRFSYNGLFSGLHMNLHFSIYIIPQ